MQRESGGLGGGGSSIIRRFGGGKAPWWDLEVREDSSSHCSAGGRAAGGSRGGRTLSPCCHGLCFSAAPCAQCCSNGVAPARASLEEPESCFRQKPLVGCVSSQCSGSSAVKPVKIPVPLFTIAFPCESPGGPGAPGVSRAMFLCSRLWFVFLRSGNLNAGCGCATGRCLRGERVQLPIQ